MTTKTTPTNLQRKVLGYIYWTTIFNETPPTVREITKAFGWNSINNTREHINRLIRKGLLRPAGKRHRNWQVTSAGLPYAARIRFEIEAAEQLGAMVKTSNEVAGEVTND